MARPVESSLYSLIRDLHPDDGLEPVVMQNCALNGLRVQAMELILHQFSDAVLDHWMRPRNAHIMSLPDGCAMAEGACHSQIMIFLRVHNRMVVDASFSTNGCVGTVVTGSAAVEIALGHPLDAVVAATEGDILSALGGLPEYAQHCAELASDALRRAAEDCLQSSQRAVAGL